jgi:hypothetical protein
VQLSTGHVEGWVPKFFPWKGLPDPRSAVRARNKWLCALKAILGEVKIYGPQGDPDAPPAPKRYTQLPWDLVKEEDERAARKRASEEHEGSVGVEWRLSNWNASIRELFQRSLSIASS